MDRPFDLYGYYIKISLVVLPLDVLNLCVLQGIVLLRKYTRKSYTYIPPPVQRGNRKQTYLLYYMLDILFTFCANQLKRKQIISLARTATTPTTQLLILSFILVSSCNHHFEGGYQTANAQATEGDVNVLYAGSLIVLLPYMVDILTS
jgi:hypothetical protein